MFAETQLTLPRHALTDGLSHQAAEHEARLLTCALPALRLLRHCLGRLSDAGAEPPVGPLDAVGALLDFEVWSNCCRSPYGRSLSICLDVSVCLYIGDKY